MLKNVVYINNENFINEKMMRAKDLKKIFTGIAQSTFDTWVKAGHLNRYKICGSVFYKYSEVKKMIENARMT